jgi:16S rRNA (cytosine967-C5)-methyltransferase
MSRKDESVTKQTNKDMGRNKPMDKPPGAKPGTRTNAARPPLKPKASKLKGGISFAVFAAVEAAATAVASGKPGDAALAKAISQLGLSPREGARAFSFADQIFRHWARLSWLWTRAGRTASGRDRVLLGLRLFLDASVSDIAALLRERDGVAPLEPFEANQLDRIGPQQWTESPWPATTALECPDAMVAPLRRALGEGFAAELNAMLAPPAQTLRVNTLKTKPNSARESLAAINITVESGRWSPLSLSVPRDAALSGSTLIREGLVEVQDEASQLIAALVDARPGMQVLDLCAGAGGKTLAIAATMQNKGHLVAADIHAGRLQRAKMRLKRAGAQNAECLIPDAKWFKSKRGRFDRVLIDAPCSGTGAWARNPDQRWTLDAAALARLTAEQDALLDRAARLVAPGGHLIYATCSLLLDENEDRIAAFLVRTPQAQSVPAKTVWNGLALPPWPCEGDTYFRMSPYRHGTDGFFAAVVMITPLADGQA